MSKIRYRLLFKLLIFLDEFEEPVIDLVGIDHVDVGQHHSLNAEIVQECVHY